MMSLVPPSGTPTSLGDVLRTARAWLTDELCRDAFGRMIRELTGVSRVHFVNSGRTAQTIILKALHALDDRKRDEVVLPAYTCFSVPASVVRAGLKVRLVDIDPNTLDYDYTALAEIDFSNVLAISSTNLFGIISNWSRLREIAKSNSIYLIDDAAQAMGSSYDGSQLGSLGDAGLFSLDRGKNLSTFSGGVILVSSERIDAAIQGELDSLTKPGRIRQLAVLVKLAVYGLLLRPRLYWIPASLPFLGLGKTIYDEQFEISGLANVQLCAGAVLFPKLDKLNEHRRHTSQRLASRISSMNRFSVPGFSDEKCPAYLRVPVLAEDSSLKSEAVRTLRRNGISAPPMYPTSIRRIPGIESRLATRGYHFPGADAVVNRLLSLPTHAYVSDKVVDRMISCLQSL